MLRPVAVSVMNLQMAKVVMSTSRTAGTVVPHHHKKVLDNLIAHLSKTGFLVFLVRRSIEGEVVWAA